MHQLIAGLPGPSRPGSQSPGPCFPGSRLAALRFAAVRLAALCWAGLHAVGFRQFNPRLGRLRLVGLRKDEGMSTVEYALGTLAAAGLAVVLYEVLTSSAIRQRLTDMILEALK